MNAPQLPSFLKEKPMNEPVSPPPTNIDIAARARSGMDAVDALIKERDHHRNQAANLLRNYDAHTAKIESLERQLSMSEAKLTYYQNLSTSLITRLSSISMTVEDAMRESKDAAARGDSLHTSRPGISAPRQIAQGLSSPEDQLRLADLAKRLAPEPQEPMDLPK